MLSEKQDERPVLAIYVAEAIKILGIKTSLSEKEWIRSNWERVARRQTYSHVASSKDVIEGVLRGNKKYPVRQSYLKVLHHILGLNNYGLSVEDVWKAENENRLRLPLEEFVERLKQARLDHADPLKWIRENVNPLLDFEIEARNPLTNNMMFSTIEGSGPDQPPHIDIPVGKKIVMKLRTRCEGRILLVSHNPALNGDGTRLINKMFGVPPVNVFEANRGLTLFANEPADGLPGARDIIAINWPVSRDPNPTDLELLFQRQGYDMSEQELRRLAGEVLATADAPLGDRVSAALVRINLLPVTGAV